MGKNDALPVGIEEWLLETTRNNWDYWRDSENYDALRDWYGRDQITEYLVAEERLVEASIFDMGYFHNDKFDANFENWKRPYWTINESVALTFGKDPALITSKYVLEDRVGPSTFAYVYKTLRDQILQQFAEVPIRPRVYIEWLKVKGVPFPKELEEKAVPQQDDEVDDYRCLYRIAVEDNARLRENNARLQQELKRLQIEIQQAKTAAVPDRSGAPGRPTSIHLVGAEHIRRRECNEAESHLRDEAKFLAAWLRRDHPNAPPLKIKTIENGIRAEFNARKLRN